MCGMTAQAWQGDRSIPVASPGTRAFRPWTLTKGAFVLPVEPMTKGALAPPLEPTTRGVPSLDLTADRQRLRPEGNHAPWNRDRGFGPGDDQGALALGCAAKRRAAQEPAPCWTRQVDTPWNPRA